MWTGRGYEEPAYMKAVSREVSSVCTLRVCSNYNLPWFNIGSGGKNEWIKVEQGKIMKTDKPKELKPTSHSKEEQNVIKEEDIFGDEKKEQFRVLDLYIKQDT